MKNQINRAQRNFVVEYKSNRRQPKEAVKSIWGDADLHALSNAVVDDMPPPIAVERQETSEVIEQSPAVSEDQSIGARSASPYEPEHTLTMEPVEPICSIVKTLTNSPPTQATRQNSKPLPSARAEKPARSKSRPLFMAYLASASVVGHDELDTLEKENRRLKGLLTDKLRSENRKLMDMLRRFGPQLK